MADILYHYCSTQSGFAILQSRTLRLSPLSAANDSLEGKVLSNIFASLLRKSRLPQNVVDVVSVIVEGYPDATEGFAFCLSENGDLLSQWRAYGRDGTGICIGFSSDYLIRDYGKVNFGQAFYEMVKVNYGEEELRDSLVPIAQKVEDEFAPHGDFVALKSGLTRQDALRALADREAEVQGLFVARNEQAPTLLSQIMKMLAPLHFRIYGTKPKTFREECEWRLLRYRHRENLPEIEYYADDMSIKPFIPCLIADPARPAINKIILGPKHKTDLNWMRSFLNSIGLGHVKVSISEHQSYR